MHARPRSILITVSLIHGLGTGTPAAPGLDELRTRLNRAGYMVQEGQVGFFTTDQCSQLPNCYGLNPASPYGFYYLPPAPGETPPDEEGPRLPDPEHRNLRAFWRLRQDEAVIFLGRTPPESRYFSLRSYLWTRQDRRSGEREDLAASLGLPVNQLTIRSAGTPDGAPGNAFDQETAVITTANQETRDDLRRILEETGVDPSIVNTDVVPRNLPLRMGLEPENDVFGMLFRVAYVQDDQAWEAYRAEPGIVLRITPLGERPAAPFPNPPRPDRGTGVPEWEIVPGLNRTLARVEEAVREKYRGHELLRAGSVPLVAWGPSCIRRGRRCLGDNPDAAYVGSVPGAVYDPEGRWFTVVIGVGHHLTTKATYMNVSGVETGSLVGLSGASDLELEGSAARMVPGLDDPNLPYVYAYKFTGECGRDDRACTEIEAGFLGHELVWVERAYLEPETRLGPAYRELAAPRYLHFGPKKLEPAPIAPRRSRSIRR